MKKVFSLTLVAMMLVSICSFVSCKKDKDTKPVWETPTSLAGTEWVDDGGETWLSTIYFETDTTGKITVHHVIGSEVFDSETPITYTYEKPNGQYVDDIQHVYRFTIDGGTLTATEDGYDYDEVFERKK